MKGIHRKGLKMNTTEIKLVQLLIDEKRAVFAKELCDEQAIIRAAFASRTGRDLLTIGIEEYSIKPSLVFVQFLPGCARMGQAAAIAIDSQHPQATIIPDVFHMHIGHSGFAGIKHLRGDFFAIFQFNDAPADPPLEKLKDEHRVFPGDGILPLVDILRDLKTIDYRGCVSLELYNPAYWQRNLEEVAREGRDKTLAVIAKVMV